MQALALTVFFSLLLAAFFVLMFYRQQKRRGFAGPEKNALQPLEEEKPVTAEEPLRKGSFKPRRAHP
jgi:hypothetical protein